MDDNTELMVVQPQNLGIAMTPEFAGQLALALSKVHPLTLDGTNAFHRYDYPTVAQVRGNAGQALAQAGIGIIPEVAKCMRDSRVTGKGGTTNVTVVQLRMHLYSTKGSVSVNWVGESEDLTDKGTAKAISAGVKSFLIAFLMMPFGEEENDDGKTDSTLNEKRAKSQPDDISAIIAEANKHGVTFGVDGMGNLRPVHGDKMPKELNAKVIKNAAAIVEYIKANAASSVPTVPQSDVEPESSKRQPDEPPAVPDATIPKATTGAMNPTQATTTGSTSNGKAKVERPMLPKVLRDFIHAKADQLNAKGAKATDRDRQQLAAAMDAAFTDTKPADREAKRHRVCEWLTGWVSLGAKSTPKMPDWYVGALKAWLSFEYKDGKYVLPQYVIEEANRVEHEALLVVESLSSASDFAAECLTVNYTVAEIQNWLATEVGWLVTDWPKCEPAARELIVIARTQGKDLLKDDFIREWAIGKATELWLVAE